MLPLNRIPVLTKTKLLTGSSGPMLAIFLSASFSSTVTAQPYQTFVELVRQAEQIYTNRDYDTCLIMRIEGDFDHSGSRDIALSTDCPYGDNGGWGNAGGTWRFYLNLENGYEFVGDASFHDESVWFEPLGDNGEFYLHTQWGTGFNSGWVETIHLARNFDEPIIIERKRYQNTDIEGSAGSLVAAEFRSNLSPLIKSNCRFIEIDAGSCGWRKGLWPAQVQR